jgi:hypothetical protein
MASAASAYDLDRLPARQRMRGSEFPAAEFRPNRANRDDLAIMLKAIASAWAMLSGAKLVSTPPPSPNVSSMVPSG